MGEVYDALGTIGRVDSYVTLICCCLLGCSIVGVGAWVTVQDDDKFQDKGLFLAAMIAVAVCMCLCGAVYVFAARKSKHVAALGGFMALT